MEKVVTIFGWEMESWQWEKGKRNNKTKKKIKGN